MAASELIKNHNVNFGIDVIANPPCDCKGKTKYKGQPVQYEDVTTWQVPNNAQRALGSEQLLNPDFLASLVSWSQGTGSGGTNAWSWIGASQIRAAAISKILLQAIALDGLQSYRIEVDVTTLPASNKIYIVGFNSLDTVNTQDYTILDTLTTTGSFTYELQDQAFVAVGVYHSGNTAGNCELSLVSVKNYTYSGYPAFEIKDATGSVMYTINTPDATYRENLLYSFNWSSVDLNPGCHQICIKTGQLGTNLFTDADNGSFEANANHVSGDRSITASASQAFNGLFSGQTSIDEAYPPAILIKGDTQLTLKPNTQYKADAWVYLAAPAPSLGALFKIALSGFTGAVTNSSVTLDPQTAGAGWKLMELIFTTGSTVASRRGYLEIVCVSMNAAGGLGDAVHYFDQITLIEYEPCSQTFNLQVNHGCSVWLEYHNSEPAFGFIYPYGYTHGMRVMAGLLSPVYKEEVEEYTDSEGNTSIVYASSVKNHKLTIQDAPEYIHDALRVAFLHDYFYINGERYVKLQGDYSPKWRTRTWVAGAEVELREGTELNRNKGC